MRSSWLEAQQACFGFRTPQAHCAGQPFTAPFRHLFPDPRGAHAPVRAAARTASGPQRAAAHLALPQRWAHRAVCRCRVPVGRGHAGAPGPAHPALRRLAALHGLCRAFGLPGAAARTRSAAAWPNCCRWNTWRCAAWPMWACRQAAPACSCPTRSSASGIRCPSSLRGAHHGDHSRQHSHPPCHPGLRWRELDLWRGP